MATFITSKAVGQLINIDCRTSTGYWKYNHNGSDSNVFTNGVGGITVENLNGQFTLISCDVDGNVSGDIISLGLEGNQLTSFDGTGLSSLAYLGLYGNQLTSFDGTGLSGLTTLDLGYNQLTSFDGTGLSGLTTLVLYSNQLTSFDGTGLSGLTTLDLKNNQLTSFDGTVFSNLIRLVLDYNQLTSLSGFTFPTSLTELSLDGNQLTPQTNDRVLSFFATNSSVSNPFYCDYSIERFKNPTYPITFNIQSFVINNVEYLTDIQNSNKQELVINSVYDLMVAPGRAGIYVQNISDWLDDIVKGIDNRFAFADSNTSLTIPSDSTFSVVIYSSAFGASYRYIKYANGHIALETGDFSGGVFNPWGELNVYRRGSFYTSGGRTAAGTASYDTLISRGWIIQGADLIPTVMGKIRVKGATQI